MGLFGRARKPLIPGAMYQVDDRDRVVELKDFPQSSVGAPCPLVLSDEYVTVVAFYLHTVEPSWDGTTPRSIGPDTSGEEVAIVRFEPSHAILFGPPNDEAFSGHPLAKRGLEPYSAVVVENSSWVRGLERMNAVHRNHRPETFNKHRHFILSFHDSVFECVADGFTVERFVGSVNSALPRMAELLAGR